MLIPKQGVTILELLVLVGIVGVLLALLLPAVQSARESARKVTCKNNLRQMGIAIQSFHSAHQRMPSLYNGSFTANGNTLTFPKRYWDEHHFHSWQVALLPSLEQSSLYESIDMTTAASDPKNQPNVNVELSVFQCPSTSNVTPFSNVRNFAPNDVIGTAARSDYEAIGGIHLSSIANENRQLLGTNIALGAWGLPLQTIPKDATYYNVETTRFRDVTDGLSNSIILAEMSGRPDPYVRGKLDEDYEEIDNISKPAWAISGSYHAIVLSKKFGVNETNHNGIYSFHASGVHVSLADGSVRMLSNSTNKAVLQALTTRAGRETVSIE
ncbi:DUF1559 domain-containing protein [Rhodopirellula europaea]|uniref:Protein containing DUF1559 n=1 Tax=Rhodopirellula europaea 6C TaxID=1263867 RepID=M2A569_9BACT|nr:DUF1559 domain-containing protein [Rhodopirellula europaea]EMB15201.1 protein containing DUF1559 [Rhodopirellula europaea 6C]